MVASIPEAMNVPGATKGQGLHTSRMAICTRLPRICPWLSVTSEVRRVGLALLTVLSALGNGPLVVPVCRNSASTAASIGNGI